MITTTTKVFCNNIDKIRNKTTYKAIKAIIAMIDVVMGYVADRCYTRGYVEIDDINLHNGKIRVGWGDDTVNNKGFWAEYDLETGILEYDSWGIREKDTFHGVIEKPWDMYRKIISGIEYDIKQHVIQKKGNFFSEWC